jgi:two-component system sensor histidine kinase/response regulator
MPPRSNDHLACRADQLLREHRLAIYRRTDRVFAVLLVVQWLAAIVAALSLTPQTWVGATPQLHPHVTLAMAFGGAVAALPLLLILRRPGERVTRYTISVAQIVYSGLLIHITGGRIETHFHVFGSLAILAAYRDWTVLVPATLVTAADHFVRGLYWPESVFGVTAASPWRTLEHAGWVVFEDLFLYLTIRQSVADMQATALQTARLEHSHEELQRSSQQLADSFKKEREIVEGALDAVIQMDAGGRVTSWNSQAEQVFGWSAAEAIARPVAELIVPRDRRDAHLQGLQRFRETGQGPYVNQRLEVEALHRDGHAFPIEIAITPIHHGAEPQFCAFIRDITARKQYERELKHAKEQAEAANRTKSDFLANMSHEIRTPLNGILGFTELLIRNADGGDEAERRDYVRTIRSSGKHLLELINDILDLSKIEAGKLQVELTACSPHHIIAEVVSVLRARAQEKGISLDYRWDSQIPESIQSDPYRLRQTLMNLVGNAVKFTEIGGVKIVARLVTTDADARLEIAVTDTGIGIESEQLDEIFKPFVQSDNSMTRRFGGTGLGLTITKNICESLGGTLQVTSEPGRGSTFVVRVPTGDLANVRLGERPPAEGNGDLVDSREQSTNLLGLKILLVDDGETNRKLIQLFLARQGAVVTVAENGELAVAAASRQPFDAILMDMQMPVMDGYAATRILRQRGFEHPIIALTAHAMLGDRKKCEEAGCSGYVTKPVNVDDLVRAVLTSVRRHPRADAARATTTVAASTAAGNEPIHSTLPTDDFEIRALVAEFAATVPQRIEAIENALALVDFDSIAALAHALKGAGGTAGFHCLTDVSQRLEAKAHERQSADVAELLDEMRTLHQRIVV